MAGYECTDQQNAFGNRVDFLTLTTHLQRIDEDYQDLAPFNIQTVREGIRWSQVERTAYHYDWSTVAAMIERGRVNGIQQIWDICHFGYPDDMTPLHPMFARRFAHLCRAFVNFYRSLVPDGPLIVTPINEVSFMSWLGGDTRGTVPYCVRQGWEVKYGLMRAYIEGVAALREADPTIRILTTEPLVNIVPPLNATPQQKAQAAQDHENQFQSVDMLAGRLAPELGGSPAYLDILGFNYYYNNQWSVPTFQYLNWNSFPPDARWRPLHTLLADAYYRYGRPIVLTETSHPKEDRPIWLDMIARESAELLRQNIPFWGVCIYPIIDRPDWDHLTPWHRAGLWDAAEEGRELSIGETPGRVLHQPSAHALLAAQATVQAAFDKQSVPLF